MNQEHMDPISLEFKFIKKKLLRKMNFVDVTEPSRKTDEMITRLNTFLCCPVLS